MKFKISNSEPSIIKIGDKEYRVKFTIRSMIELEELTGRSFGKVLEGLTGEGFSIMDTVHMLYVALKGGGTEVALEDIYDLDFETFIESDVVTRLFAAFDKNLRLEIDKIDEAKKKKEKTKTTQTAN